MSRILGSWKDYWRHERGMINPASRGNDRHVGSLHTSASLGNMDVPHAGLSGDPLLDLAHSLERFHSWQLSSGFDLLHDGMGPQTASDLLNMAAARDHQAGVASVPAYQPPAPEPAVFDRPWHKEPWHDPMSTIPGGPGSMGPVR
jgi:hypothetical protein